jgi:HEPN domain-containing protein
LEEAKTYVDLKSVSQDYRTTGDHLLRRAKEEFDKGDLLQASEKSWGAVGQHLKALATERGEKHRDHSEIRQVAQELAKETGNPEIRELFSHAESLHSNFYEAHMDEETVRDGMDRARRCVSILREVPSPSAPPRKPYVPGRPFYRTRNPSAHSPADSQMTPEV